MKNPSPRAVSDAAHHGRSHRAKCPMCGKIGSRSLFVTKHCKPKCWIFKHGITKGPLGPYIGMAIQCFVAAGPNGEYDDTKIATTAP